MATIFMMLEKETFNHDYFKISDDELFKNYFTVLANTEEVLRKVKIGDITETEENGTARFAVSITICETVLIDKCNNPLSKSIDTSINQVVPACRYRVETCHDVTYTMDEPGGGGWGGSGGNTGSGSGGGGGSTTGGDGNGCKSIGYKIVDGVLIDPCTGGTVDPGGDGGTVDIPGWIPEETYSPDYLQIQTQLNINQTQYDWLKNHLTRADEIHTYLTNLSIRPDLKYQVAVEHLNRMMTDPDYYTFVDDYAVNNPNTTLMWWENGVWLDDPANFSFDIDGDVLQGFRKLNAQEKALTLLYPISAFIIKENEPKAWNMAYTKFPTPVGVPNDHTGQNDRKNAFLHAYFNAINTRDVTLARNLLPATAIVQLFADAHESDTPQALDLEKQMDNFNNKVGIDYCWNCFPLLTSDNSIADAIMNILHNGELRFLDPLNWIDSPKYDPINNPNCTTCLNGITNNTLLIPTN